MRKGPSRRRVVVAALLATAITAVLVPSVATTAAPEPSLGELRAKLAEAIADEQRALALLRKKPPRTGAARLPLDRSIERLGEILMARLHGPAAVDSAEFAVGRAIGLDRNAQIDLPYENGASLAAAKIEEALQQKAVAMTLLAQPASAQGTQCADRIDNDGDGLIDARHDSGCASKSDGGERSALTCSLGYTAGTSTSLVQGSCSGPFAKLELTAPTGVAFDPRTMPTVEYAQGCRYATERKLECVMSDGVANPRHLVSARFKLRNRSISRPRLLVRDFRGGGRTWPVAPGQAPSTAPYLRFKLSYTHEGLSHVCASIEADSGASLKVSIEGSNGYTASGTLQLKKKATKTAPGGFSFRIFAFGSYKVTIVSTADGKSVTKSQTISVTGAPGDSRCSATGAPPP